MWSKKKLQLSLCLVITGLSIVALGSPLVRALSGSEYIANRITDDAVFYNGNALSVDQVQSFLNSKVPICDTNGQKMYNSTQTRAQWAQANGKPLPPYTCLKDFRQDHGSKSDSGLCSTITSKTSRSAAQIIDDVARACNISQKALIIMLQKEQSLITDDWPWPKQYQKAMGYYCPDDPNNPGWCHPEYAGFFNQVYNAALQLNRYRLYPENYNHSIGRTSYVAYQANAPSCGGTNLTMQTAATAALYNYTPYQPNAAALNNLYGIGDACSAYGNRNYWRMFNDWFGSTHSNEAVISFKSHVGNLGWLASTEYSGVTGTTGERRVMEAFKINGLVEYSSYNSDSGWQPTVNRGMISGTTGQKKPIQAIKINPIGTLANQYTIYYRAHVSNVGWMGWAKNGAPAGVTGDNNKNIEAFEIMLVSNGSPTPATGGIAFQNINTVTNNSPVSLNISSHVGNIGWQPEVTDNMVSGTTEESRPMEAVRIELNNSSGHTGTVMFSAHVAGIGWQDIKTHNEIAGTIGQARQMEAFRLNLTGNLGTNYDVWYRAHVAGVGWLNWAKNGEPAGSVGVSLRLEAIEVRLTPKGVGSLPQGGLYNPKNKPLPDTYSMIYSTHLSNIGWVGNNKQNDIGGTTGQSRAMEAIRFDALRSMLGDISITCSAYVRESGWVDSITPPNTCGTTGQSKPLESIKLNLTGGAANIHELQYKVHVSTVGWGAWQTAGSQAGTPNQNKQIEAVIIRLVAK
jgi:uncharacterized protein YjdB